MARQIIPDSGLWSSIAALLNSNFTELYEASLAQVSITHPSPAFLVSVTGTGDKDLNPANGGYVDVLNGYSQALLKGSGFEVLADGRVKMLRDGTVKIDGYADVSHSNNNTTVGAAFSIERGASMIYSPRAVHAKMPNAGDIGNISGMGSLNVLTNDIIGIALASDVTGDISIRSSSLLFDFKI